ncbi:MFS transporter [Streptomyces gobiensis]|uniref:MFS transporter n=1 Tax=Streptomyces gobiensis TaxID=2875706 RepID=UPI001E3C99ED|nr:MFS transporter [Streptomyces gobiensis]UGY92426.1 MFS transporter [Streptomyces gobiensis]
MTVVDQAPGSGTRQALNRHSPRPGWHARAVLISVIGLYIIAETALAPFLPQLFQRLYGISDPGATGLYLWICRIVGLAALPLWGLAARRWTLHRLILTGLCAAAVLDLLLGFAPNYASFTALSAASVATNAALLLAYPAFIAEHSRKAVSGQRATSSAHARLAGICSFVVVFHVASVAATVTGAGVLALPEPRVGISAFALLDVVLAVLIYRVLGQLPPPAPEEPTSRTTPVARLSVPWLLLLAQAALIGVAFDFAVSVARPFFTELSLSLDSGPTGAAVLFFLPSVAALAVLPAARRCHDLLGDRLLPVALTLGAVGLASQYLAAGLPTLAGGRLLFGLGLGLGQVAVELRMFRATGTAGPAFTAVETVRSAGLLAAPLVAAAAVSQDLALPLAIAAAVLIPASLISLSAPARAEENHR